MFTRAPSRSSFAALLALGLAPSMTAAQAPSSLPPPPRAAVSASNGPSVNVTLVRQDGSDCQNSTVSANNPDVNRGVAMVSRNADGSASVKVAITASPNTTYHFFLKCVRPLGDLVTGDEGEGMTVFSIPAGQAPARFAFDMYPEGAPSGNKFQSTTVVLP